jgi:hypothetical protein
MMDWRDWFVIGAIILFVVQCLVVFYRDKLQDWYDQACREGLFDRRKGERR